jgi:hypothetical protein
MFHETFGYYAQGVTERTAILPEGWRDRLVAFETKATNGVRAMCLDVHDLWIAKAIANRPKDVDFCRALVARRLVNASTLAERLAAVEDVDSRVRSAVAERIRALRS